MSLYTAHETWAWIVVASNALAGLWALGAHRFAALRTPVLWWFTGAAQFTFFVQAVLGVVLLNQQGRDAPEFHMFYGFVSLAGVGIIYSYRQQLAAKNKYLLYGFGGLFLMGMALRATFIGGTR